MSNYLAIAAVTATLRNTLQSELDRQRARDSELADVQVTALPLDRARENNDSNQINLFLYQTAINASWSNLPMPDKLRRGESGFPPLPLELFYLITAYGRSNDEFTSHQLLGRAMSILHDRPLLSSETIKQSCPGNDLYTQPERIRITPQQLTIEEVSKLWTAFQSQYRVSAAYRASVVLIESTRETKAALPVLRRGRSDEGASVLSSLSPYLRQAVAPQPQPSIRLGEDLSIMGEHLDSQEIRVRISGQHLLEPIELDVSPNGTANEIMVHLENTNEDPAAMSRWAPGFYTVALVIRDPNLPAWVTNEVPFALSPLIEVSPNNSAPGDITITVVSRPRLRDGQRAILLFGSRQIPVTATITPEDQSEPTTLKFTVPNVEEGTFIVRLRVDGVDSLPITRIGSPPQLEFDPAQMVVVK